MDTSNNVTELEIYVKLLHFTGPVTRFGQGGATEAGNNLAGPISLQVYSELKSVFLHFTPSWKENSWIQTFPKVISAI